MEARMWAVTTKLESGGHKIAHPLQGCVPYTDARATSADQDPPQVPKSDPSHGDRTISEDKAKVLCEEVASCREVSEMVSEDENDFAKQSGVK